MLNSFHLPALLSLLFFWLCSASGASASYFDPPERVAGLGYIDGEVSYSPAGESEWFSVVRNRPLIRGDRLWTDRGARAQLQIGSSVIRLDSNTGIEILDLDDRIAQIQLTGGRLDIRVRRMYERQTIEVDTPTLAFVIDRVGHYRIGVDPSYDETTIVAWDGDGEAYGENSRFSLRAGEMVRFYSPDLRDYDIYRLPHEDEFDRYCLYIDRVLGRSESLRYIDDDVVGYADLDEYGSWRPVQNYGHAWFPTRVDAGWAPYRDGHWIWQEPWGWTWVDNAPWGFAPSHYGRWVYVSDRWGWVPGPRHVRSVYAPALVAFVGGSDWSLSISLGDRSPIGWFPIAPHEVYVPPYQASRDYFQRVNVNNTVINNTTITNVYNNYSTGAINVNQADYAYRRNADAVTAVPRSVFVNAEPVRRSKIRLDRNAVSTGEIRRLATVAPSMRSVIGAGKTAKARPTRETIERRVLVRNAPPVKERPFAAREKQLQKNPGRALESGAATSAEGRGDKSKRKNVLVIQEQTSAVDARAAGDRHGKERESKQRKTDGDKQADQQQRKADSDKQAAEQQQRKADRDKNAAEQQQRKADSDNQADQQQRKADSDKLTVRQQRKADSDTQADQQQRKADSDKQAAEQQQRKADRDKNAAEQQQRKADSDKQTVRQQRKADGDKQADQQQRKDDSDKQAVEQQQRKADRDKQADQQQQRKVDSDKKATQQPVESQQIDQTEGNAAAGRPSKRQTQAECVRQARLRHEDESQCTVSTRNKTSRKDDN